jgi:hypothetical protein
VTPSQATSETTSELPDELAAIRALTDAPVLRPGGRAEHATRSASIYLAERRRRLRRELALGSEAPARRRGGALR